MKTDEELIKEFQGGSEKAFNDLVKRHINENYGFFIKFNADPVEAEDLAQDVFIKMYKALKKFRFQSKFKTYLYRANMNMSNTYLKRSKWRNLLHLDPAPEPIHFDTVNEDNMKYYKAWFKRETGKEVKFFTVCQQKQRSATKAVYMEKYADDFKLDMKEVNEFVEWLVK